MYMIQLEWKEFSINLEAVSAAIRADHDHFAGAQAHAVLELWFTERPSSEEEAAIVAYWAALDEDSEEATSYKSAEEVKAEAAAAAAALVTSATSKLEALGLSAQEIAALRG